MKPFAKFKSLTFFAAKSISNAEANSAAENSFKTKQHLKGSNFSNLFFGIKNIVIIFILSTLPINYLKSKECLNFLPFGHNDYYVHLPVNSNFCVKYGNEDLYFKTDKFGGRLFNEEKDIIQVFGDSQVLGIDIDKKEKHYLSNYIEKNFVIYGAPNNGPYEVLKFILLNKKNIKDKIIININLSVDIFRLYNSWDIKNFVALKSNQLDEVIEKPYKYKIIITKNLLSNKFFTVSRKNNKEMRKLFLSIKEEELKNNFSLYLSELEQIKKNFNIDYELILTLPYWLYEEEKNKFLKIDFIDKKLKNILCETFLKQHKLSYTSISKIKKLDEDILTIDKRHLKSDIIALTKLNKYCSI